MRCESRLCHRRSPPELDDATFISSDALTPEQRAERGSYVGCIAGALSFGEYEAGLRKAGFIDVSISPTHAVADGMFSAIVKAHKPVG